VAAGIATGATAVAWNGVLLGEAARLVPAGQVGVATAVLGVMALAQGGRDRAVS
jgi:hypothetical protein